MILALDSGTTRTRVWVLPNGGDPVEAASELAGARDLVRSHDRAWLLERVRARPALRYADALGNRKINCLVGCSADGVAPQDQYACLVENLRSAAARLPASNSRIIRAPVSRFDPVILNFMPAAYRLSNLYTTGLGRRALGGDCVVH